VTRPWADPAWRSEVVAWASAQLDAIGRPVVGEVTQPHVRPWSTVLRIPTGSGPAWCKASGPGTAYEGRLLEAFARWGVEGALLPLATDPERSLILFDDGGPTLRATRPDGTGDHDLDAWARVLRGYAALQRSVEVRADELVALGVPDGRPERLPDVLEAFVADDTVWERADPEDRAAAVAARRRLPGLLPAIRESAGLLGRSGVPSTIQHDDLHGGNVLVGPAGDRIFDWGDAVVAHPFGTLTVTMNSIAHHAGLDPDGPELGHLRDAYLEAWSDVAPRRALDAAARRASVLGAIGRAAAWQRSLAGLEVADMDGHAGAPAAWLVEFVERLDRARRSAAPG
jgi:hypothetical protein